MNKPGAGRPVKYAVDQTLSIRIDQETQNALVVLASSWQCGKGEAARRAIRQAAGWPTIAAVDEIGTK